MTKKKKIVIGISVVVILSVLLYLIFGKKSTTGNGILSGVLSGDVKPNGCDFIGGRDFVTGSLPSESAINTEFNDQKTDCQLAYMNKVCGGSNWKCRKFIVAGGYIPTDYEYNDWGDIRQTDARILEWAYELYYLSGSSWASSEAYELLKQAEYQAAKSDGLAE